MVEPLNNEQNSDFEKLNEDQREKIMTFSQIVNEKNIQISISFMEMSNFDIEKAVALYFENQGQLTTQISPQIEEEKLQQRPRKNNKQNQEQKDLVNKYKDFILEKRKNEAKAQHYIASTISNLSGNLKNFWNNHVPVKIRGETLGGEEFKSYMKQNYQLDAQDTFQFQNGNFSENFQIAASKNMPLLIFIQKSDKNLDQIQLQILKEKSIIEFVNKNFHILGLLSNSKEINSLAKALVTTNLPNPPCFLCVKQSLFEEADIDINNEMDLIQYLECLKQAANSFYLILAEQDKIKQQAKSLINNNLIAAQGQFFQQGPAFWSIQDDYSNYYQQQQQRDPYEDLKILQDRKLRERQENELREARKQEEIQKQKEEDELNKLNQQIAEKQEEEEKQQKLLQEIIKQKEEKRKLLPIEPDSNNQESITFQFKFPDGQKYYWRTLSSNQIKILFDYIDCNEEISTKYIDYLDNFDLIQTIPFLSLKGQQEQTIDSIFSDSKQEILYIKKI